MIFQLSYNNFAEKLIFPVNPPSYKVSGGGTGFNDITVVKKGEATVIGDSKLRDVTFSSFFPRDYDPSYCNYTNIPEPWEAVRMIERWRKTKWPVRLIITEANINMPVTIRQFDYEERGGEPGDIYFDIALKEYKFIVIRQVVEKTEGSVVKQSNSRPNMIVRDKTHTVKGGDTLWKISKVYLDDGGKWETIYNVPENKKTIGANPNVIKVGQRLVIPT